MKKLLTALLGSAAFIAIPSAHADTWTGAYGGIFGGYGWSNTDVGFLNDAGTLLGLGDPCEGYTSSSGIGSFKGVAVSEYWEGPNPYQYCNSEYTPEMFDVGGLSLPGQSNLGSFDADGEILGVTAGINYQTGNWVFGIESEGGMLGLSETIFSPPTILANDVSAAAILAPGTEIVVDGGLYLGVFGRLGYSFGNTLLYGKAGYGAADLGITVNIYNDSWCGPNVCWSNTTDDMTEAFMFGAGIEHIIANGLSLKLEYVRMEFDETSLIVQNGPEWNYFEFDTSVDTVKLGLNFHLGSGD